MSLGTIEAILADLAIEIGALPRVKALVVLGSVSRGEESYVVEGAERRLSSDVELLSITAGWKVDAMLSEHIVAAAAAVEARHIPHCAASFHIDVSVIAQQLLPFVDRRFIHFETRESGRIIAGSATALRRLPAITPRNLNFSELHAIFIHRLAAVLLTLEALKEKRITEEHAYGVICRNGLDLLSVLLPHCGQLAAGYLKRQELARKILPDLANKGLESAIEILTFTEHCLLWKLGGADQNNLQLDLLIERFIAYMSFVQNFIEMKDRRHFFRRSPRRILAALLKFRPKQLALEWRRGREEAMLANELSERIVGLRVGRELSGFENLYARLSTLYPGVY